MAQTFLGYPVIVTTGFTAATGAASARSAIPVDASGNIPNYIRIAGTNSFFKLGTATVTATSNDSMVQPGDSQIIAVPKGMTHIAYIQNGVAGQINVVPCENS